MATDKTSTQYIRSSFLDFFHSKQHIIMKSASLLPSLDPTLLFNTAGMVPFKNYYDGIEIPPSSRLVSVQKCLRTTDLENVGKTKRHLSFFEMLGNFAFGDYFKKEAIEFAWEYTTQFLPFPQADIWVSIYLDDDEAFDLWHKYIGLPKERIVRLDKKDNFWGPVGNKGSCGPCSEIYLDRGLNFMTNENDITLGTDGERFLEFWNLVFVQFFQDIQGKLTPLKQTGIDTGAGLERLASLAQGVDSVYDIDELLALRIKIENLFQIAYEGEYITPIRIIIDHIRSLTFAISDGIYPSNESRGYVLRRLLRRAVLYANQKMSQEEPTLFKLVDTIVDIYGSHYETLNTEKEQISRFIRHEEERFLSTLKVGSEKIQEIIDMQIKSKSKFILGKDIFLLYDTYGFPVELTQSFAALYDLDVDIQGYERYMAKQQAKAKASWNIATSIPTNLLENTSCKFVGYQEDKLTSSIITLFSDEDVIANTTTVDRSYIIITKDTPFYPEGGGQLADKGIMKTSTGVAHVYDVKKKGNTIYHFVKLKDGQLEKGQNVMLQIDSKRREALARHHSATHLLNHALRLELGEHVRQSGSLVDVDYLRFDFTHFQALSHKEISNIEAKIEYAIQSKKDVSIQELPIEEAKKIGALMTFGEKYENLVRIVDMGEFSKEFCGGTHVQNTKDIGFCIITRESSPGSGKRRIEVRCAEAAETYSKRYIEEAYSKVHKLQNDYADYLSNFQKVSTNIQNLIKRLENVSLATSCSGFYKLKELHQEIDELNKKLKKENKSIMITQDLEVYIEDLYKDVSHIENSDITLLSLYVDEQSIEGLRAISDLAKNRARDKIYLLFTLKDNKWFIFLSATDQYAKEKNIHLGHLLKASLSDVLLNNSNMKGGGGGKPNTGQGSGVYTNISKDEVKGIFEYVKIHLSKKLSV